MHSIIPAFMMRDGKPHMAFGVMGGNMQARGHEQMTLRDAVDDLSPQPCSDAPRWRINDVGAVTVESAVDQQVVEGLTSMGYRPEVQPADSLEFGSAQLIRRLDGGEPGSYAYVGDSDHRRAGKVVGY